MQETEDDGTKSSSFVKSIRVPSGVKNGFDPSQYKLSSPPPDLTNRVEPGGIVAGDVTLVTLPLPSTNIPTPVKGFTMLEFVLLVVPVLIVPLPDDSEPSTSTGVPSLLFQLPEPL